MSLALGGSHGSKRLEPLIPNEVLVGVQCRGQTLLDGNGRKLLEARTESSPILSCEALGNLNIARTPHFPKLTGQGRKRGICPGDVYPISR